MKKHTISWLLIFAGCLLCLTACGDQTTDGADADAAPAQTEAQQEQAAEESVEVVEEVVEQVIVDESAGAGKANGISQQVVVP